MEQHEKNVTEVIDATRQGLAQKIIEAEVKEGLPQEAVIVTKTESIVYWGNELERNRFKKQWLNNQAKKMNGEHAYELKKIGRCSLITSIEEGRAEIHQTWDTADVEMTGSARKRLEANASKKAIATQDEMKKDMQKEMGDAETIDKNSSQATMESNQHKESGN